MPAKRQRRSAEGVPMTGWHMEIHYQVRVFLDRTKYADRYAPQYGWATPIDPRLCITMDLAGRVAREYSYWLGRDEAKDGPFTQESLRDSARLLWDRFVRDLIEDGYVVTHEFEEAGEGQLLWGGAVQSNENNLPTENGRFVESPEPDARPG